MDQTLYYDSNHDVYECILRILNEPQQYECKWGTSLWYKAERISDMQILITFTGGQFRKGARTQYLMEFLPQDHHTLIVLRFQKELFGLPPMTHPFDIDLCMKQKLNAVRRGMEMQNKGRVYKIPGDKGTGGQGDGSLVP